MLRFFTGLFGARTTHNTSATKTAQRVTLSVESLESRATPSGISQVLKHIGDALHTSQALANKLHPVQVSHMTLAQALTVNGHTITLHR